MQTNNNPFTEVGVILIALGFIAAGTTLLALGKVDLNVAMTLYILAASVAGINVALKAPSPTQQQLLAQDRKSTRLNSSHQIISYAVFCLKKKRCAEFSNAP